MPLYHIGDTFMPPTNERLAFAEHLHTTILAQPEFLEEGAIIGTAIEPDGCPIGELRFPPPPIAHILDFVVLRIAALRAGDDGTEVLLEGEILLPAEQPTPIGFEARALRMRFHQVITMRKTALNSE